MRKIFYDFEVFKHNWLVVLIDYDTKKEHVIIDNADELKRVYTALKRQIWIGYNSRMYDQFIFKGILDGDDPYRINNKIIVEGKNGYNVVRNGKKYPLNNFDISTGFHSLKQLEGFMGSRIKESSVPFDIDRPLTEEELQEVVEYCRHDVQQTIEVFDNRKEEFESQLELIETFNLSMSQFTKTKAQLSAFILGAEKIDRDDEFDITIPDTLRISDKYQFIVDWYLNPSNLNYNKKLDVEVAGVPHTFGFGGVHGAVKNYKEEGIILCCDVASLYPTIMIEYGFLSRNVTNPEKFREIRDTRLRYKAAKDKRQAPLKIVINSTFGASKDQFNQLFDPLMANNVCIGGQLLLLDLIEKIEPYGQLIQSNTDGIFMKVENESDIEIIKEVAKEWETRTRLELEWDIFHKIYQKDVNNYIIIDNKGKYKSKGAYVKKLGNLDYDLPIVNKALVEYFIKGTPVEETINNCNKLREFQKIVKVSSLYKYALHGDVKLPEKVLRVFASNNPNAKGVTKVKTEDRVEKIANTPERCFIDNDNVKEKLVPEYLDKDYYIDLAQKRLNDFLGISNKKKKVIKDDNAEQLELF